jgi:hypothetical protein
VKRNSKQQGGQTAVFFTMIMTSVFSIVGLVTDFGWAYYRKQTAQAAAQAAAIATVKAAMTMSGGVCGNANVVCQSETSCPANITTGAGMSNIDKGCLYAQQNGYRSTGKQKVTIETGTTIYNNIAVTYWASAKVSEDLPTLFTIFTGNTHTTLTSKSVAGYIPPVASGCLYVIAPTGAALTTNGNTLITTGCGIWVNSDAYDAINLSGGNTTITDTNPDTKIQIVGGYQCYGQTMNCISPAPQTGARSAGDPLAGLPAPTAGSCTPIPNIGHGTTTIDPGTYCGTIGVQSNDTLVMNPGTYIFKSGGSNSCGFSASAQGNVSASGVTLYFADSCSVSISGNGNINMSAPTGGLYEGILMYQARTNTTSSSLTGGSGQVLNGIVYFPNALLHYAGGSSSDINAPSATIVTYNLQLNGSTYIHNAGSSPYLNTFSGYAIFE